MRRAACALALAAAALAAEPSNLASLREGFTNPPSDARILMRWWWFGPSVEKTELEREMLAMKAGGIGGFEIQPVYPVTLDDPAPYPYLSDAFLGALRFTAGRARALGLRADLTLGSGWPFGGPHIPVTEAAGKLRCDRLTIPEGATSVPLPSLEAGEEFIAAFDGAGGRLTDIAQGRLRLPRERPNPILFFISSRTGMQVKRAAVGAEGFVLDHYDRAAIESHLKVVGERLLSAFGNDSPYAVFSDSLEVYASDWTPGFLEEFQKRRGYDLTPHLPALLGPATQANANIRHDWGQTLTELAEENYLKPIEDWARRHGTRFRSQTYGIPPVVLSSNALVDLPEGEGSQWRSFTATRWASSASHLYGRPVTSSEIWTWLHSPAFRATPLDMKAEADLHFLQGVNQLIGHGWPYSPESAGEPGWRFYAAAVFNTHNPWWLVMPDIARYLQRISYLLRQGRPANDIAVYLPTHDAYAQFTLGNVSVDERMNALLGTDLIPQILDAGYSFDFIDDGAIAAVGIPYPVLILPGVERVPPATASKIEEYLRNGGLPIATRHAPSGVAGPRLVRDERTLGAGLHRLLPPDFETGNPAIGFVHRKLDFADVYFVANTSNQPARAQARVRAKGRHAQWWDPLTGGAEAAPGPPVAIDFAPYESRILVLSGEPAPASREAPAAGEPLDISSGWTVTFPALGRAVTMARLHSWTEDEETRYYSGVAVYEKTVTLPRGDFVLDFGPGTPVPERRTRKEGMRAWLEAPVREAAVVSVNGKRAGSVWHPPYRIDLSGLLRAGENRIRVEVGNLAINTLAGQSLPDYRLLSLRYGSRFEPQDMNHLEPLPAGILGPLRLVPAR